MDLQIRKLAEARRGRFEASVNIDLFANSTAGTIPLGLMDAVAQKRLRKGVLILLIWSRLYHWCRADALGILATASGFRSGFLF
jgi:hypothetical protein